MTTGLAQLSDLFTSYNSIKDSPLTPRKSNNFPLFPINLGLFILDAILTYDISLSGVFPTESFVLFSLNFASSGLLYMITFSVGSSFISLGNLRKGT